MKTEWRAEGRDILSGSVGFEGQLVRIQAGWDVVVDELGNQFFKAPHQKGVSAGGQ